MGTVAIIPVKSFSTAKSRLGIPTETRRRVCAIMLKDVLHAATESSVSRTLVVSRDEEAIKIAAQYGADVIRDESETGVNDAIALANADSSEYETSIVLPQDIPLVQPEDIDTVLRIAPRLGALVVPSRKLDGTNALVRTPSNAFKTHYDEDSYRIHMSVARQTKMPATLAFIRNIMIDIDTPDDLKFVIENSTKTKLADKLRDALG